MKNYIALIGLTLIATGCSNDMKSSLGLKKHAPDEFTVISNPALSVPPDFALSNPGEERKSTFAPNTHTGVENKKLTKDEQEFIQKLGHKNINGNVAKQVDQEYQAEQREQASKGAIRKAVSKFNKKAQPVIDPFAEKARMQNNLRNNIPVNEGDVKYKSKSTLDNLLN